VSAISADAALGPGAGGDERELPPIAQVAVASLILVVVGGIFMAVYLPRPAPLGVPIALIVASGALIVWNLVALVRLQEFAWDTFFLVVKWALLAYGVISGMLFFMFARNHTRGAALVVLGLMLVEYAVNIPLILAYTVARYQKVVPGPPS